MKDKQFYRSVTQEMVVDLEQIKRKREEKQPNRMLKKGLVASIAMGIIMLSGISAAVYGFRAWSTNTKNVINANENEQIKMEQMGYSHFPTDEGVVQAVTVDGVTISIEQTIVDNYFAMIFYKVSGVGMSENESPGFEEIHIEVDGEARGIGGGYHYNANADGNFEFYSLIYPNKEKESLFGKSIKVELKNLGIYGEQEVLDVKTIGEWTFNWTLEGNSISVVKEVDALLGDTGIVITEVEYSPISIRAVYHWDNGEMGKLQREAPYLSGVRLKDGTLLHGISVAGGGNTLDNGDIEVIFSTTQVIDVDEVVSFLFVKEPVGEGEEVVLDCFYEIPVNR